MQVTAWRGTLVRCLGCVNVDRFLEPPFPVPSWYTHSLPRHPLGRAAPGHKLPLPASLPAFSPPVLLPGAPCRLAPRKPCATHHSMPAVPHPAPAGRGVIDIAESSASLAPPRGIGSPSRLAPSPLGRAPVASKRVPGPGRARCHARARVLASRPPERGRHDLYGRPPALLIGFGLPF